MKVTKVKKTLEEPQTSLLICIQHFTSTVACPAKSLAIPLHTLVNLLLRVLKDNFVVLAFSVSCFKFALKEQVIRHFCSAFMKILPVTLEMYKYTGTCMSIYKEHIHT